MCWIHPYVREELEERFSTDTPFTVLDVRDGARERAGSDSTDEILYFDVKNMVLDYVEDHLPEDWVAITVPNPSNEKERIWLFSLDSRAEDR